MNATPRRRHGSDYHAGFRWGVKWGACAGVYAILLLFALFAAYGPEIAQCIRWP